MPHFFAMKHKKLVNLLMTVLSLIGFMIVGWFAFLRPDWLLIVGIFTSIPGYFLILLCLMPVGSVCLGDASERLSQKAWFWGVAKAHFVMLIFTITVFLAFFGGGPAFMHKVHFGQALATVADYTRLQWGIFPWGVYGIWGLAIAYCAYIKKSPPYLYAVVQGAWPKRLEPMVKSFVDATQFGATILGVILVASAIVLLSSYFVEKIAHASHFVIVPITFSFLSFFVLFIALKSTRLKMRQWRKTLTLNRLLATCMIILFGLLVISAFVSQWFIQHYPQILSQIVCKQCGDYFTNIPQEARFAALYWGWWITWVPLGGSYLAKLSQGRTIRQFVLGLFAFPFTIWLIVEALNKMSGSMSPLNISPFFIFGLLLTLPFLSWWLLAKILKNAKTSDFFLTGYMPVSEDFRRNRLWVTDASKVVGLSKYAPRLIMAMFATLFLHCTAGWYGIQIQLVAMAMMTINNIYGAFDFLVIQFFKDKIWLKKQAS